MCFISRLGRFPEDFLRERTPCTRVLYASTFHSLSLYSIHLSIYPSLSLSLSLSLIYPSLSISLLIPLSLLLSLFSLLLSLAYPMDVFVLVSFQVIKMKRLYFRVNCVQSFYRLSQNWSKNTIFYQVNNLKSDVQFTFK